MAVMIVLFRVGKNAGHLRKWISIVVLHFLSGVTKFLFDGSRTYALFSGSENTY